MLETPTQRTGRASRTLQLGVYHLRRRHLLLPLTLLLPLMLQPPCAADRILRQLLEPP